MSHERRTPLNHIIGFTEMIVDKKFGELNETQEEFLNDVLTSSKHLLSLINDILDLSKVEAGKLELSPSNLYLKGLLENSLTMIKEKAMKHRLQLSTDFNGIPEFITADERKLKQIVYNLLSNAVKFTPAGGKITLATSYLSTVMDCNPETNKDFIKISVSDTGIGLKRDNLETVFEPFEQVKNSAGRIHQGTGLGLSLTKKLVELHGGRIWAVSEGEGKGSTFNFLIPI